MKFNLKDIQLTPMQKMMVKMLAVVGGIVGVIVIISIIVGLITGGKKSFAQIEKTMVQAAKNYVKANPEKISGGNVASVTTIGVAELIGAGYMKELAKYTKKDVICSGSVLVFKNLDYIAYSPNLVCGDSFASSDLISKITASSNIVDREHGLYQEEDYFIYKGEFVNNYVMFANQVWRILRINSDGTIRMIQDKGSTIPIKWDGNYNIDKKLSLGINSFEGVANSNLKNQMLGLYNDVSVFSEVDKGLIVPQASCIGKREIDSQDKTGNIECAEKSEIMGVTGLYLSEFLQASIDPNCVNENTLSCKNYNYLAKMNGPYWTVTAVTNNTWQAYSIDDTPHSTNCSILKRMRLVVNVQGKVKYDKGDGTQADPYIIKSAG